MSDKIERSETPMGDAGPLQAGGRGSSEPHLVGGLGASGGHLGAACLFCVISLYGGMYYSWNMDGFGRHSSRSVSQSSGGFPCSSILVKRA